MKLPLILLLNLLVVATGLFVYDTVRADRTYGVDAPVEADRSLLEARVASLEQRMAERGPELRAVGTEDLMARILTLEAALRARPAAPASAPTLDDARPFASGVDEDLAAGSVDSEDEASPTPSGLDEKDVKRVQRLMEEADRRRREEWAIQRLDRTLERLDIELSAENKQRVMAATDTFRTTLREAFGEARASGLPPEDMGPVLETARVQLTSTLESFLPASDAEQLVQALSRPGRRAPGGGPGGARGNR